MGTNHHNKDRVPDAYASSAPGMFFLPKNRTTVYCRSALFWYVNISNVYVEYWQMTDDKRRSDIMYRRNCFFGVKGVQTTPSFGP